VWAPKNKPIAICLIVHGGGWHSGYFEELALSLNQEGIFCASYDQVCHGYSDPEPGAPEGCIHIYEFDDLVEDIFAAVVWAKKEAFTDSVPIFLLGESFGGLQVIVAALDARDYGVELAGIIVLGALIKIADGLLPPRPVLKILSWLAPYYALMKMPATDMMSKTFDDAFGDPKWALACRMDPAVKVSPRPTLAGAITTVTTGEKVATRARELNVPLLAVHGVRDCRADFDAVHQFVDQAGSDAEGFWIEDTSGHQLLQDRKEVTDRVKEKVADWIIKRVGAIKK
jgi:alpha-beta hydrolase superfamily lysophospholipase